MADRLPYPLPDKVSIDLSDPNVPIRFDDKTLFRERSGETQMQDSASRTLELARRREGLADSSTEAPVQNGAVPFKNLRKG